MYLKELEIAKKAAVMAGKAIMEVYESGDFGIEVKEDDSPLTLADKAANSIIVNLIREEFPSHAILSEEEKDDLSRLDNDLCFVIDPLDGTKEFIKQNGQFTVNIALSYRHRTVMGVIYVPVTGEIYYAAKGHGSFMEENGKCMRLHVNSEDKQKSDLNVVMSNSHGAAEMDALIKKYGLKNYVKVGSSLKGCMIAKGAADVYYRFGPTMEWDTAAMQCIVEEAGGLLRQMDGTEMLYNREDSLNRKGFYILNRIENILE